jgi:hypothetical protein
MCNHHDSQLGYLAIGHLIPNGYDVDIDAGNVQAWARVSLEYHMYTRDMMQSVRGFGKSSLVKM